MIDDVQNDDQKINHLGFASSIELYIKAIDFVKYNEYGPLKICSHKIGAYKIPLASFLQEPFQASDQNDH